MTKYEFVRIAIHGDVRDIYCFLASVVDRIIHKELYIGKDEYRFEIFSEDVFTGDKAVGNALRNTDIEGRYTILSADDIPRSVMRDMSLRLMMHCADTYIGRADLIYAAQLGDKSYADAHLVIGDRSVCEHAALLTSDDLGIDIPVTAAVTDGRPHEDSPDIENTVYSAYYDPYGFTGTERRIAGNASPLGTEAVFYNTFAAAAQHHHAYIGAMLEKYSDIITNRNSFYQRDIFTVQDELAFARRQYSLAARGLYSGRQMVKLAGILSQAGLLDIRSPERSMR